jgi:hypothetical protein
LAAGGNLTSILAAVQEREERLQALAAELYRVHDEASALDLSLDVVMPEVRRRLTEWQAILGEESTQARPMLRSLLRGRLVFNPDLERNACEFVGVGDLSVVFRGLINLPKALASPTGSSRVGLRVWGRPLAWVA